MGREGRSAVLLWARPGKVERMRLNGRLRVVGQCPILAISWCVIDARGAFDGMFCCSQGDSRGIHKSSGPMETVVEEGQGGSGESGTLQRIGVAQEGLAEAGSRGGDTIQGCDR
jgi:hypothetical protein